MNKEKKNMTGKEIISSDDWANCYICEHIFKRKRMTKRYCYHCKNAFCEGEHGTFEGKRIAVCIRCYSEVHAIK